MARLRKEVVNTWFDLCLFLDRVKDTRPVQCTPSFKTFDDFKRFIRRGIGFVTYNLGIDGVSIEKVKYARSLDSILNEPGKKPVRIHWIAGAFDPQSAYFTSPSIRKFHIPGIDGFDEWGEPYFKLFHTKLQRGSREYNELPPLIWEQTLSIAGKLASYIEKNHISLLLVTNTHSNPGNLPLALSIVLVSELMAIPVVCSNHDFYWEDGKAKKDRRPGEQPKARDHFFTNADIGEVFSFQQVLYPWDSRTWIHVNINSIQSRTLVEKVGISPANVMEMTTAVDTGFYRPLNARQKRNVWARMNKVISATFGKAVTVAPNYPDLKKCRPVVFGSKAGLPCMFDEKSLVLLQPTRIIQRKRIEKDIDLVEKMLRNAYFLRNVKMGTLVLLITGPVAAGHMSYLEALQERIRKLFARTDSKHAERVRVAFFFGTKIESFCVDDPDSIVVPELYGVSRLILLPSETEGRGLPIVESAAAGVPIAPTRYRPEEVFVEVIGEKRPRQERFDVLEFPEETVPDAFAEKTARLILDDKARHALVTHNRAVVQKRYSYPALKRNFEAVLRSLWLQTRKDEREVPLAGSALRTVHPQDIWRNRHRQLNEILYAETRTYLPGYAIVGFLLCLKSLIDPSYFRVEEQELRSRLFVFARGLVNGVSVSKRGKHLFYNCISRLFLITRGKEHIGIDHSFNYRHRTRVSYPYRELTEQELQGTVVFLAKKVFGRAFDPFRQLRITGYESALKTVGAVRNELSNWTWALRFLVTGKMDRMNSPMAVNEISRFVKSVVASPRHLLHMTGQGGELLVYDLKIIAEKLLMAWSAHRNHRSAEAAFSVTFAAKASAFAEEASVTEILGLLKERPFRKLKRFYESGLFRVVSTGSLSSGANLYQASPGLREALLSVKSADGIVTARGENNYFTLNLLDIDAYWFGTMCGLLGSKISGFLRGSDYFLFVPAGMRPTLSYPTPVQNAVEFAGMLRSKQYISLVKRYGSEKKALQLLKEMSREGLPLSGAFRRLRNDKAYSGPIRFSEINGVHSDGLPWTGSVGFADLERLPLDFTIAEVEQSSDTVLDIIKRYEKRNNRRVEIGWNGGYILNAELVGKLGLPESYIGTPLGLLIKKGRVLCLPLFAKPAFGVKADGSIVIGRVTLSSGSVGPAGSRKTPRIAWEQRDINPSPAVLEDDEIAVYNLLYDGDRIPAKERVVLEIAGDHITRLRKDMPEVPLSPIGITVSVPAKRFEKEFASWCTERKRLSFDLNLGQPWEDVVSAVEAGPLFVDDGRIAIDMESEGWNRASSIRIQAARLDRLDLRGPKIGAGVTADGNVIVVTINGRTRDSVGAIYSELAKNLLERGAVSAMGFDPGGSTTLVTQKVQRNISPYNRDYEKDPYTLPPQPRGVTNAILGVRRR